jgi:hypothetical protein
MFVFGEMTGCMQKGKSWVIATVARRKKFADNASDFVWRTVPIMGDLVNAGLLDDVSRFEFS